MVKFCEAFELSSAFFYKLRIWIFVQCKHFGFVTSEIHMCQSCLYNHIILALVKCDTKPTMTLSIWNKTLAFLLPCMIFCDMDTSILYFAKNIGSANRKSANCHICGRTPYQKNCKSANLFILHLCLQDRSFLYCASYFRSG